MVVFLSHKMNGLSEEEILKIRKDAEGRLKTFYGDDICILDNYHHKNVPENAGRVWHLGESIKMMEKADLVCFCPGWEDAKGCQIEFWICLMYGIKTWNLSWKDGERL